MNHKLAHPGKRYQGQFIDTLVSVVLLTLSIYLVRVFKLEGSYSDFVILTLPVGYFVFCDALPRGQSVGKIILGLSVVHKDTGKYCTLQQSFLRNITTPIVGAVDILLILGKDRQRFGDRIANTIVIQMRR